MPSSAIPDGSGVAAMAVAENVTFAPVPPSWLVSVKVPGVEAKPVSVNMPIALITSPLDTLIVEVRVCNVNDDVIPLSVVVNTTVPGTKPPSMLKLFIVTGFPAVKTESVPWLTPPTVDPGAKVIVVGVYESVPEMEIMPVIGSAMAGAEITARPASAERARNLFFISTSGNRGMICEPSQGS